MAIYIWIALFIFLFVFSSWQYALAVIVGFVGALIMEIYKDNKKKR